MSKPQSFNDMSRQCEDHLQDEETRVCFCDKTGKTCNTYNCPKGLNGQESK